MKVGFILECTPGGADFHVFTHLTKMINDIYDVHIDMAPPVTLGKKQLLIPACGRAARELLETEKCDRVLIIWDQNPERKGSNLSQDREDILAALNSERIEVERVSLVGIKQELASWLIADSRAIERYLHEKRKQPRDIPAVSHPEDVEDPQSWITDILREYGISKYHEHVHAGPMIKGLTDFQNMANCQTFVRFVHKLSDIKIDKNLPSL